MKHYIGEESSIMEALLRMSKGRVLQKQKQPRFRHMFHYHNLCMNTRRCYALPQQVMQSLEQQLCKFYFIAQRVTKIGEIARSVEFPELSVIIHRSLAQFTFT